MDSTAADFSDTGPSFAQMLRTTGTRGAVKVGWPKMDTSNVFRSRGVASEVVFDTEDVEGYVPAPSYSQSFGNALAEALEHTDLQHSGM